MALEMVALEIVALGMIREIELESWVSSDMYGIQLPRVSREPRLKKKKNTKTIHFTIFSQYALL